MPEKDYGVSVTGIPQVGQISKKPCYLITLVDGTGKSSVATHFIAMDTPGFESHFIKVKGIYSDSTEEEITKKFSEIVSGVPRESIVDIMFPVHRVHSIRSLVFNAHKPSTLVK
jgi:hypothetical protein